MFFLIPKIAVILLILYATLAAFRRWRGVRRRPGQGWRRWRPARSAARPRR